MATFTKDYNPGMVILASAVGFIGAFATISLCEQFRLALVLRSTFRQTVFIILTALSAGSVAIWGVFYLVVNSVRLKLDGQYIPFRYDTTLTFVSLAVIPVITGIGLYIASTDHCFNKSKKEIMDMFISRTSSTHSISEIKNMGKYRILFIVCTHSLYRIVLGGIVSGGGLALMRYLGLRSLVIQGRLHYDSGIIGGSIILSIVSMIGGFWMFFRVLSIFSSLDVIRFACAVNGLVSLSGIHYLALAGVRFEYDPTVTVNMETSLPRSPFIISILSATVVFSFLMLISVLSDLREWLLRTSAQLRMADLALFALMKKTLESREQGRGGVRGHFQAPLEVITYTRRFMSYDGGGRDKGGTSVGGMVLQQPLFNDFDEEMGLSSAPANDRDPAGRSRAQSDSQLDTRTRNNSVRTKPRLVESTSTHSSTQHSNDVLPPSPQDQLFPEQNLQSS